MSNHFTSCLTTRHLKASDLEMVTTIHLEAFPESALTKLGREAVRRYYEWQMIGPHDAVNIGVFDDGAMLGFCFGGIRRGALGGFLEKNRTFLMRRVITHPWLLFNPLFRERAQFALQRLYGRVFRRQVQQSKTTSPVTANRDPSFGILSIAVNPKYQGGGAAQLLIERAEQIAHEKGFTRMGLTVHPTNLRAVHFYEKVGWKRVQLSGEWTGSMEKDLTSAGHEN